MKAEGAGFQNRIEDFIAAQVTGRGLDGRTEKAYRQDLENFYMWLEKNPVFETAGGAERSWETELESYLEYLSWERRLRPSTVTRKRKVFTYYLSYLVRQGILPACRPLKISAPGPGISAASGKAGTDASQAPEGVGVLGGMEAPEAKGAKVAAEVGQAWEGSGGNGENRSGVLSKQEVDALFRAVNQEYENLDSDFRRRVCLRDLVMLGLLFYHRVEVSELLRLQARDYDPKTGYLFLRRKRGKEGSVYVFSRALRRQMEQWLGEREYFEHDNEYHNYMFLSKLGRPLSMKMVINVVDKYRRIAGIEKEITPKDLKKGMERYARELVMERCG